MAGAHPAAPTLLPSHILSEPPLQNHPSYPVVSFAGKRYENNSPFQPLTIAESIAFLENVSHLPPLHDLVCILQKCKKQKDLALAKRIHQLIKDKNLEAFEELGNYLVPMYVECGSMRDAEEAFDHLPCRNEHSWTSLIQGYTENGNWQHAFDIYERMQLSSVPPNRHTFLAILRTCIKSKFLRKSYEVHAAIAVEAFDRDLFVGSTLVDMYAKYNLLLEARNVFDRLHVRNVVSWTAIIKGYVDNGQGEEALSCLEQMQLEGVTADLVLFVSGLRACCLSRRLDKGLLLHLEIVMEECESDRFISSTLLDMYVKSGMLAEAQDVFDNLEFRDVVLWTILISGYIEHEMEKEALDCLEQMHKDGIFPNSFTFNSCLKACCSIGDFARVRKLHMEIAKEGLERDTFVGSTLVDIYAKHISLLEARDVFDELPMRDVVLWTALMTGYTEQGYDEEALDCLKQMEQEGILPDAGTYVCVLKSCSNLKNLSMGQGLHVVIAEEGLEKDSFLGSALLDMYAKCSRLVEARDVFDELPSRSVVAWTALIDGYVEHGLEQEALLCFELMQKDGMPLDAITFVSCLKACSSIKALEKGQAMHVNVVKEGFEENPLVRSTLVYMYSKCGSLAEAQEEFDQLTSRDVVSWTALTTGYAEQGFKEESVNCFQQMQLDGVSPDAFSWNAVIAGHAQQGDKESAFRTNAQMQDQGLLPNNVTFANILKVCSTTSALKHGERIHAQVYGADGYRNMELILANVLIDMYCKCGSMENAQQVFDDMPKKDIVSWNTLITGYGRQGEVEHALRIFERMRGEGFRPEDVTFLSVLSLCSHAGLVDEYYKYFEAMSKEYGMTPSVRHHNCLVDLLGRAGRLSDLMEFIGRKSFKSDIVTWSTVLGACHQWGYVEFGKRAFNHILMLDKHNSAAFTLMSNIFADAGMWEDAKKIEAMRTEVGAPEQLEQSWVECNGSVEKVLGGEDMGKSENKYLFAEIERVLVEGECTLGERQRVRFSSSDGEDIRCQHTARLATMRGVISTPEGSLIRVVNTNQLCIECHWFSSLVSKSRGRTIVCRDIRGFHCFINGQSSCKDYCL